MSNKLETALELLDAIIDEADARASSLQRNAASPMIDKNGIKKIFIRILEIESFKAKLKQAREELSTL